MSRRLRFCYVVPGHDLLPSIGPSRNVINLARALSRHAEVTLAFHRVADAAARPADLPVLEIEPAMGAAGVDDAAMKGVGYRAFWQSLQRVRQFASRELPRFDVVLEKSWLLSGFVSDLCRRQSAGPLGVPIENIVPDARHAAGQSLAKLLRVRAGRALAGRYLRRAPLIIAETEFLKREIARFWRVQDERIAVVELGVDRALFRPQPAEAARQALGINPDATVLLYVGVLDRTHNLEPAIRALAARAIPGVELHVVGDGFRAAEYRALAAGGATPIRFHGRVPHDAVPAYIAAADLCLAPYDAAAFASGELGYSTMKIPEYLAVGRAVASVSTGRTRMLIQEGRSGMLFDNTVAAWQEQLARLPERGALRAMGEVAAATRLPSWEDTADAYLAQCEPALAQRSSRG